MSYLGKRRLVRPVLLVCLALCLLIPLSILETSLPAQGADGPRRRLDVEFSLPSGYYTEDLHLRLAVAHPEAEIRYTVDGSNPTRENGSLYSGPLNLSATPARVTALRARAFLPNGDAGPVTSASYILGLDADLPFMSLIIEPEDLWGGEEGIFFRPDERGEAWERPVDVFFWDEANQSGFQVPAGIRVHGGASRWSPKKSMRLYFRDEYGQTWLSYPLFADSGVEDFKRLILHAGGNDQPLRSSNATLLRNFVGANLASEISTFSSRSRPTLLFINGQLWGIYYIRERLDQFYFADHFDAQSVDYLELPGPEQAPIEGDVAQWNHLFDYVTSHDLSDPAHYAYIKSQIDIENFIDYNIAQIYFGNFDWPRNNYSHFRPISQGGRWHWLLWDIDVGFALAPSNRIEEDMYQWLFENEDETVQQGSLLLRKLMENPEFQALFLTRMADLLNTTFSPESVIRQIDLQAEEVAQDFAYENQRWPSAGNWLENVQFMRDYATRRPDIVRQHFAAGFGLPGTAELAFERPTEGAGRVAVNGQLLPELPWKGGYFQGTTIQVTAVPDPGFRFVGWEQDSLPPTESLDLTVGKVRSITPRFVETDPAAPRPGDAVFQTVGQDGNTNGFEGDWLELIVKRSGGLDLRGWRITDNDSLTAVDEGSLILGQHESLAAVPQGTTIVIVASETPANDRLLAHDDLDSLDRRMVIYAGNGLLDVETDPWFSLSDNDNVVLLAPGPTTAFADDQGIAFRQVINDPSLDLPVTPADFGVLSHGVTGYE